MEHLEGRVLGVVEHWRGGVLRGMEHWRGGALEGWSIGRVEYHFQCNAQTLSMIYPSNILLTLVLQTLPENPLAATTMSS